MSESLFDYAAIMRIFLLLMSFFMALPTLAEVYRSVDENGNVVYSDQPSEGAEVIKIDRVQTIDALEVDPATIGTTSTAGTGGKKEKYSKITFLSPTQDQTISTNNGDITVALSVTPELETKKGDSLVLYMDGSEVARGNRPLFDLVNLERGSHSMTAAVVNGNGIEIKRSDSISFTIQRHSVLHPESTVGRPPGNTPPGPTGGLPGPAGGTPGPTGGLPGPNP